MIQEKKSRGIIKPKKERSAMGLKNEALKHPPYLQSIMRRK